MIPSQIQRVRKVRVYLNRLRFEDSAGKSGGFEPRKPASFGFIGVNRENRVVAPALMGDMIGAAAERALAPAIPDLEQKRRMRGNCRMERVGVLPGAKAYASDPLAEPQRAQRHAAAIGQDAVTA